MCGSVHGNQFNLPLSQAHAEALSARLPHQRDFIQTLLQALTTGLNPPWPVLSLLIFMKDAVERGHQGMANGIWGSGFRFPLAVVTPNGHRFRTPMLDRFHEDVLSLNMSASTMIKVDKAFQAAGLKLHTMCSCGIFLFPLSSRININEDPRILEMDRYRSMLDRQGTPVHQVTSTTLIPRFNMDWLDGDRAFHEALDTWLNQQVTAQVVAPLEQDVLELGRQIFARAATLNPNAA